MVPVFFFVDALTIVLFTVCFSHLHDNVREAISGYFVVLARNCLARRLDYTVMQMRIKGTQ